jgi:hypothetical protein
MIRTFSICLAFIIISLFAKSTQAITKFNTSYQITYQIDSTGITTVEYFIKQKNNLSTVFATEFSLAVNDPTINTVRVFDQDKPITPTLTKTDRQTIISFKFINKVVGVDKVHDFSIRYQTSQVAEVNGQVWQINLPKLEVDPNISELIVIMEVPDNIPSMSYIDPKPDTQVGNRYYFSNKTIFNKTPIALFGQIQTISLDLTYTLANTTGKPQTQQITLPPQTNYQTIHINTINPTPELVTSDPDQNLLAQYTVPANQELVVTSNILIKQNFHPQARTRPDPNVYLTDNKIWDYNHSIFRSPEITKLTTAKQIYDYVVASLDYDYRKISSSGTTIVPASQSFIKRDSAICVDFSHVLIALLRKQGIPAREVQGYAITDDPNIKSLAIGSNVLHSWVEYYDSDDNLWKQIDPTWSKTTNQQDFFNHLDLNRITLVYHGLDPITPSIIGLNSPQSIKINYISDSSEPEIIGTRLGKYYQSGSSLNIELVNPSGSYQSFDLYNQANRYISQSLIPVTIPPLSSTTVAIPLHNLGFANSPETNIITINGQRHEFIFTPSSSLGQIGVFAIGIFILVSFAYLTRHLLLRRKR